MSIGRSVLDASVFWETSCFLENGGALVHDPLSVLARHCVVSNALAHLISMLLGNFIYKNDDFRKLNFLVLLHLLTSMQQKWLISYFCWVEEIKLW